MIPSTSEPVALQPLALIDDAAERAWAAEWIANILKRETIVVTPEAKDHLWSALTSLASAPPAERTLTGLSVLLQSQTLKRALQPYCLGGPYGRLLDAEAERLGEADVQAFETEGLIGTSAAPAVLAYLFHRIEARLDGRPTRWPSGSTTRMRSLQSHIDFVCGRCVSPVTMAMSTAPLRKAVTRRTRDPSTISSSSSGNRRAQSTSVARKLPAVSDV
jgi:hypothetical protein